MLTRIVVFFCGFVALMGFAVAPAGADIIEVPDDFPTIQEAIDAAVDSDEILVASGTYFENIDFLGKAIWLHSSDGAELTIIDAQQTGTVVTCDSAEGPDSVLEGFTISGGNGSLGGGMFNEFSSPTVTNCTFSGNSAGFAGGGMYNAGGSPTVTNCTFDGNWAGDGGGMFNVNSNSTVTNCTFTGNFGLSGGGMLNIKSDPTVTNCTFNGNTAAAGGGMYNVGASPTVTNCTFSGNEGLIAGGGMGNISSSPTVTNCTFTGNSGGENGGGMSNLDSSPTVTNCTFSENSANDYEGGGGMSNRNSSPTVTNCTFNGNSTAQNGGGMYNSEGNPTVTNCTFSGNEAFLGGGGMGNISSSPTVTNCILWGDSPDEIFATNGDPNVTFSNVEGGFPGTGNIDADPLFVDANGPDGIPGTEDDDLRLMSGSPCIDAGDNTAVPPDTSDLDEDGDTKEPIPFDLDGNPRFVDDPDTKDTGNGDPPIVDMGAYEFQGPGIIEASFDIKPGSCPNSFNRNSNGVLPVALVGTDDFDITEVDLGSILLTRTDGVGGSIAPHEGPPGPHSEFEDVATPFEGEEQCDCHELESDGILDLSMKFKSADLVDALELGDLKAGELVSLTLMGDLLDGTPFEAADCIRIVPPGDLPGIMAMGSTAPGVFIDVTPLDETLDGGGFVDFKRTYSLGTIVTLTAPQTHLGWVFVGWDYDKGGLTASRKGGTGRAIEIIIIDDEFSLKAIYRRAYGPGLP